MGKGISKSCRAWALVGLLLLAAAVPLSAQTTVTTTDTLRATGNLTISPVGDVVFNPTGNDLYPAVNYDLNLGLINYKYLTLHAAELWVETLVAQSTLATIGGRILVGPTTILVTNTGTGDTAITSKYALTASSILYLEADGKVEFMRVNGDCTGTGPYVCAVTRDLDGSGANQWYAGDAAFNTGTDAGTGFIDLYSVRGVKAATEYGPTIVGNVRLSTTYNDWAPRWAIGNLNGLYGYSSTTYGAAFGDPAASWVKVDSTNGVRLGNSSTTKVQVATDGTATFTGTVTAGAGAIGGWTIGTSSLTDTAGVVGMSSAVTVGDDIRFFAGDATPGNAEFRVTEAGNVTANTFTSNSVTINDANGVTVTSTSGTRRGYKFSADTNVGMTYDESDGALFLTAVTESALRVGSTARLGCGTTQCYAAHPLVPSGTKDLGGSSARWDTIYGANLDVSGGTAGVTIDGVAGLDTTTTCGAGTAIDVLTTHHGVVTAASCSAVPSPDAEVVALQSEVSALRAEVDGLRALVASVLAGRPIGQ